MTSISSKIHNLIWRCYALHGTSSVTQGNFGDSSQAAGPYLSLHMLPSGKTNVAIENGPLIVELPIKNGEFP